MSRISARARPLGSPAAIIGWLGIGWKIAETVGTLDFINGLSGRTDQPVKFVIDHGPTLAMLGGFCWLAWLVVRTPKAKPSIYPAWPTPYNPIVVSGKRFINERVELDGHAYLDCRFEHVTFVYNATTTIKFTHNEIFAPIRLDTDNPAVIGTMAWLQGLGALKDSFSLELGPDSSVHPAKHVPPVP